MRITTPGIQPNKNSSWRPNQGKGFMESRLIYISNEKLKPLLKWPLINDSEWEYFGAEFEADKKLVEITINNYFEDDQLYIAHKRNDSFKCYKNDVMAAVETLLGFENFIIWNISFDRAIEFNSIGVFRRGKSIGTI